MGIKYWDALNLIQAAGAPARAGRAAANISGDAAANAAANAPITGKAELWGNAIPITWGRRRIHGELLQIGPQSQKTTTTQYRLNPAIDSDIIPFGGGMGWQSNIGTKTETRYFSTFAYCFGQPGNRQAKQILTKLWFNNQVVYDLNSGQLSNEVRFKLYQGTEDQLPDDQLNGTRYEYPVAYRGLIYIVFYDYSIAGQTSSGNPVVEAEFAEEVSNSNPTTRWDTYGTSIATSISTIAVDAKKGVVYGTASNGRIYKFDIATKRLLADYPVSNMPTDGAPYNLTYLEVFTLARLNNTPYLFCTASAANAQQIFMINADTGACVARYNPGEVFAPSTMNARPTIYQGLGVIYLAVTSVFTNITLFRCTESSITRLTVNSTSPNPEAAVALPSANILYYVQNRLYKDGSLLHTAANDIAQVFYSSFDDTLIVVSANGPLTWSIKKITINSPVQTKWELTSTQYGSFGFPIGSERRGYMSMSNTGQDQRIAWYNSGKVLVLDMISGSLEVVTAAISGLGTQAIYDAFTNQFITKTNSGGATLLSTPIFNRTTGNMLLSTFLRDVALLQGYELANITIEGISDQIVGACITEKTDIEAMLDDVRRCYNFQIIKSGKKIRFTKRNYGSSLIVDASYTEEQRAIISDNDDVFVTVETEITSPTQAAGTIVINYIDPNYNYSRTPFQYKRNDPSYDTSVSITFELPIIMTQSEAAALAARALVDNNIAETSHSFRLPQANLAHEPGDLIELVFDDYSDVVRAVEVSYNADFSLSFKAEAIYTQQGPSYEIPPPVLPPEPPPLLSGEAMPLIIDTTLIRPSDQYGNEVLETYLSAIPSGRLPLTGSSQVSQVVDGDTTVVTSISGVLTVAQLTTALGPGPVLCVNYEESFTCRLVQGSSSDFHTDTLLNMLAGSNRLLVGQPGRWEQVGYLTASYDASTGIVTLTGLTRGWRGTELFAGLHQAGDYVIPVPKEDTVKLITNSVADLNKTIVYVASDGMLRLNYEDAQGSVVSGLARRPWAPYNVHVVESSGDLLISWKRRTRLSGPLNNGTGVVPLDEASEAYKLIIYRAGSAVRTLELTAPSFTYTNAMQVEDGWVTGISSLKLDVMQLSELVGPGFIKSGTYDVE